MKTVRVIQISLIVLVGILFIFKGSISSEEREMVWADSFNKKGILFFQPRQYMHNSKVYFRFYISPYRGYYYSRPYYYYYPYRTYSDRIEVYITVREDHSSGEKVGDVYIDNYQLNLNPSSPRGNRGTFSYRLRPGSHLIEWSVKMPHGRAKQYQRQFYVDTYNRSVNLLIDGDEFYQN